mmetsp:Transcript_16047/g.38307  ORF Transcript_16047/g.38307 Transcript_16047/m.38307 type:complete len:87 (+) Transcript_16047:428-688(+)
MPCLGGSGEHRLVLGGRWSQSGHRKAGVSNSKATRIMYVSGIDRTQTLSVLVFVSSFLRWVITFRRDLLRARSRVMGGAAAACDGD